MTDTVMAESGDSYSKEFVASLQAKMDAQSEETAKLRAFKSGHDEKQREVLSQLQPDIKSYINDLVSSNADYAAEMRGIVDWSASCHESKSLETAMPLARVLSCASAQYKRTREEASVAVERAGSLGAAMKELEELKGDRDAKSARIDELNEHIKGQDVTIDKFQEALANAGLIANKMDFSKLSSRETDAVDAPETAGSSSVAKKGPLSQVTSNASRGYEDELMSFVTGHSSGSSGANRIQQSTTSHAHLGATSGSVESEIAAAIKGF